jgi:hypothetical protein
MVVRLQAEITSGFRDYESFTAVSELPNLDDGKLAKLSYHREALLTPLEHPVEDTPD